MKTIIQIIVTGLLVAGNCNIFAQTWPKFYGEADRPEFSYEVEESYDKGYFILGNYLSPNFVQKATWLIKTDVNGEILWEKIFTNDVLNKSFALEPTSDGGVLAGGLIWRQGNNKSEPYVVKLSACGEKEWCKVFAESPNNSSTVMDIAESLSGDIVLLVNMYGESPEETMHLFKLNSYGEILWKKPFCSGFVYPESALPLGESLLISAEEKYLISGNSYWADPWNPGGPKGIRPTFVLVDNLGNEEWVLPIGIQDTLYGTADNVIQIGNENFMGIGSKWYSQQLLDPLFMEINEIGQELNRKVVLSNTIDTTAIKGSFEYSECISQILVSEGLFGNSDLPNLYDIVSNQNIFDTSFNVLENRKYEDYSDPFVLSKSFDDKILNNSTIKGSSDWDIVFSKLNLSLEYDTFYTTSFTYDSLCLPGPPQSGFIFLDNCDIITGIEIPTPEEYYARLRTINVTVYPNPARDKVTFALENTEHHRNITLKCFSLMGKQVYETNIITGQREVGTNVYSWPQGMYLAVVYSDGVPVGRCKFVVQ